MGKHIQVRNLPEAFHRRVKMRAAEKGMSISEYIRQLVEQDLRRPNWAAIEARMSKWEPIDLDPSPTQIIREERDSR